MKNLHITKGTRGTNDPQHPQYSHSTGEGPKTIDEGRDLQKGYDCVYPAATVAESARASRNK